MNLYKVTYEVVNEQEPNYVLAEEFKTLPTHITATSQTNAVETAIRYSTPNYQLKGCELICKNAYVVPENYETTK